MQKMQSEMEDKLTVTDTLANYRRTIKIQWNEEWKRTAEERGSEYFKVELGKN